ncbi:MarR family transcriptional regulator [Pseudomonas sp. S37]|uniref:MarR family winged helix-turn-helix transcriptional regulator n=1 Tax=Pseudomonas sp. S37 TaxID=2767449 RepID=UPI001913C134|nr:MarR family transcriptional regulator [Pseudomonas sp. S37]MBK4992419.1 MarR family transcriptional regulator [Pseudomonas sp. S37]
MSKREQVELTNDSDEPLDTSLDDLVGYALRRAQNKVYQHLVSALAEHDLRPAQFTAMSIIDQNPGLMQADLAKSLAIEPPQLVLLLNKLELRAIAVRVRCKPDKRSYGIFLSRSGEQLLEKLKQVAIESDLESTRSLTTEEKDGLMKALRKIYRDT